MVLKQVAVSIRLIYFLQRSFFRFYLTKSIKELLEEIQIFTTVLPDLQKGDEFALAVILFLQSQTLPADAHKAAYIQKLALSCFLEDGILWWRLRWHDAPARTVLVVPAARIDDLIHEMHGALLAGHKGTSKTKERLL